MCDVNVFVGPRRRAHIIQFEILEFQRTGNVLPGDVYTIIYVLHSTFVSLLRRIDIQ